jgi:Uma2 family endonuclease
MVAASSLRGLPFDNGDVMTREEFHRLYSKCEDLERVELIEGVVYLPSPIRLQGHAAEQGLISEWLVAYAARHAGVRWLPSTTLKLDDRNEVEPDAMLVRGEPPVDEEGYLAKAPELVVEIAGSSHARDLHQKRDAYERNGVGEYIVWDTKNGTIYWFELRDGIYRQAEPMDGLLESGQFPGLVMDVGALLAGDKARLLAALE